MIQFLYEKITRASLLISTYNRDCRSHPVIDIRTDNRLYPHYKNCYQHSRHKLLYPHGNLLIGIEPFLLKNVDIIIL